MVGEDGHDHGVDHHVLGHQPVHHVHVGVAPVGGIVGILCLLIFAVIFISSFKGNRLFTYLVIFVPVIIVYLMTPFKQMFVEHYFMFCFPMYMIFLGVGIDNIINRMIKHENLTDS